MDGSSDVKHQALQEEILTSETFNHLKKPLNQLHPAELADLLEALPQSKRMAVWNLISTQLKGEIILEVHGEVEKQLIEHTSEADLIQALKDLQIDELIDLEKRLPKNVVEAILDALDKETRRRFIEMREYPPESAGGLMDIDVVSVQADLTLKEVLQYLRQYKGKYKGLPEHLTSISVVDQQNKYSGELKLVDLVSLPETTTVTEVMDKDFKPIPSQETAQTVAKLFEDRDLSSAPVVDKNNYLLGRITIDDVVDYIRAESEHRLMGPVGLSEKTDLFSSIVSSVKNRIFWLGLNLVNAFLAALVISIFQSSIQKIVILAVLMPIIASMSGVIGNQTLTLVTRGIALSQITDKNRYLLLAKEASVGLINGLLWAFLVATIAYFWFGRLTVSLVFGLAMFLSIFLSALSGTVIPIILNKLKLDPAVAGGVMIVAISDILGFFIFLSIATFFLL